MKRAPFPVSFLICSIALAGCAAKSAESAAGDAAFLATTGADGYATILDAPPAPFTPAEPAVPAPLTTQQVAEQEQFTRVGRFQNSVMEEVQALAERLRQQERGNFVSLYYDNEGDPSVVFQFLDDGSGTLRKYTRHPQFFGKTVRWSEAQLMADMKFVMKAFAADRVIQGAGIGGSGNAVTLDVNVPEPEFRALVARKGIKLPESVVLRFNAAPVVPLGMPDSAALNQPLPAEIARRVRIFPRDDRPDGILISMNSRSKVVLRNGCFRLANHGDALALFPLGAKLFVDVQRYLAFGDTPRPGYARVGETIEFQGGTGAVTTPALVAPIHAACGPGRVVKVTAMNSAAARDKQAQRDAEINALRTLRDSYGLSAGQAQRALAFLAEWQARQPRQILPGGIAALPVPPTMIVNAPPPPPGMNRSCPPGSKPSFGLCRTPDGHLRPLPDWLAEFLEQDR